MRLLLRSYKAPFDVVSPERSVARDTFGKNVGNLVFSEAAYKLLSTDATAVDVDDLRPIKGLAARINAEYDALVLPLANAFRPDFEPSLQRLTRLVSRLRVPVVVLGVGAQTDIDGDPAPLDGIAASVRAFVGAVLDHAPSIGVRGEFSAEYLTGLGFSDVEVIGCPSMFRHGPDLPTIRTAPLTPAASIAVNGSHEPFRSGGLDRVVLDLRERFARTVYFGQDAVEARQLRWRDLSSPMGTWTEHPTHPDNPFFRAGDARFHVDPTRWIDELRTFDYSLGSRIHGTIAALLAGTPAAVLTTDARTLELCRHFEIPHLPLRDLGPDRDPASVLADADWGPLQAGHRARWERFDAFLVRHGLATTFTPGAGDGGRAFEERLAATDFPPPITPTTLDDLAAARAHAAWLATEVDDLLREQRRSAREASAPSSADPEGRGALRRWLRR